MTTRVIAGLAAALSIGFAGATTAEEPNSPGVADQAACVAQGMEPSRRTVDVESARVALRACLAASPTSPDLCDKVPLRGVNDVMGIEAWYIKGCSTLGLTSSRCHALMDEVAEYCYMTEVPAASSR